MNKMIPFLLGAAVIAPLYLSTPAQAQSLHQIQKLEERVQDAKNNGDWGRAADLERQLNVERLQYQRNHGMGEINDHPGYYRFNVMQNPGYYNRTYNRDSRYNRGYYDQWGRWHSY
jgi:hypothetical protein